MVTGKQKRESLKEAQDQFLRLLARYSNEGKTIRVNEARSLIRQFVPYKAYVSEVWKNVTLNDFVIDIGNGNYRISQRGVREINEYAPQT